ncbi:MAG: hypothetical protein ACRDG4_07805, partial [Chloroflexota bacterium]
MADADSITSYRETPRRGLRVSPRRRARILRETQDHVGALATLAELASSPSEHARYTVIARYGASNIVARELTEAAATGLARRASAVCAGTLGVGIAGLAAQYAIYRNHPSFHPAWFMSASFHRGFYHPALTTVTLLPLAVCCLLLAVITAGWALRHTRMVSYRDTVLTRSAVQRALHASAASSALLVGAGIAWPAYLITGYRTIPGPGLTDNMLVITPYI